MTATKFIGSATAVNDGGQYKTNLVSGSHQFIADEPKEYGGEELGPAPADYLCAALASCKAITIRMYVNRKGWKVDAIDVTARFAKGDQLASGTPTFYCDVQLTGELTDEQRKRILDIARACPVDRLLQKPSEVITGLS
jgi:putative redox protein